METVNAAAPRRLRGKGKVAVTALFSEHQAAQLRQLAEQEDLSQSQIIRRAVVRLLQESGL